MDDGKKRAIVWSALAVFLAALMYFVVLRTPTSSDAPIAEGTPPAIEPIDTLPATPSVSEIVNTPPAATGEAETTAPEITDTPSIEETPATAGTPAPPTEGVESVSSQSEGELGPYHVAISGIRRDSDYKGNPTVVLTCKWVNNSDKPVSFTNALGVTVTQGDAVCEQAVYTTGIYSDTVLTDLQPGESLEVENAYKLVDNTTAVSVKVAQQFVPDGAVLNGTFELPEA